MCLFTLETGNKEIATVETAIICSLIFKMRDFHLESRSLSLCTQNGRFITRIRNADSLEHPTDHINSLSLSANALLARFPCLKTLSLVLLKNFST